MRNERIYIVILRILHRRIVESDHKNIKTPIHCDCDCSYFGGPRKHLSVGALVYCYCAYPVGCKKPSRSRGNNGYEFVSPQALNGMHLLGIPAAMFENGTRVSIGRCSHFAPCQRGSMRALRVLGPFRRRYRAVFASAFLLRGAGWVPQGGPPMEMRRKSCSMLLSHSLFCLLSTAFLFLLSSSSTSCRINNTLAVLMNQHGEKCHHSLKRRTV